MSNELLAATMISHAWNHAELSGSCFMRIASGGDICFGKILKMCSSKICKQSSSATIIKFSISNFFFTFSYTIGLS